MRASCPNGGEGIWCAEFITADMKANPTDGPKQPFFEKEESTDEDVSANIGGGFSRLGKFSVPDAERFLKRFEAENIPFEINQDDSAMRKMPQTAVPVGTYFGTAPLIEIFVRCEDKEKATAIINEDIKI